MAFHETRFPDNISRGARGGPERRTRIVELAGGNEERNSPWAGSRHSYDCSYGIRRADDLAAVKDFFEARNGRLYGFRWKDWADYKSCRPSQSPSATDQIIGIGDADMADFQLVKAYASGAQSYSRNIRKPVAGTVLIAVDGVAIASGWSVDSTTGIVTITGVPLPGGESMILDFAADEYSAPAPPDDGAVVTAGFEFDTPVRFDTDRLDVTLDIERKGSIASIPLLEIKV